MSIVVGLSLLAFAGILIVAALRDWRLWRVIGRAVPATPDELAATARTARLNRQLMAIVGVARPTRAGALVSTVNEQMCVWHRHTVHRRRIRRRPDGRQRASLRRRRVADVTSVEPFLLAGAGAAVEVRPPGLHVDRPTRASVKVLPALVSQPFPDAAGLMGGDRYVHREWLIRSGTPLYVLAEVSTTATGVVVRRPANGPHVLSTRSASSLRRYHLATSVAGFALAGVALVAGVAAFFVF